MGHDVPMERIEISAHDNSKIHNTGVIGNVSGGAITIKNGHERALTAQEQDMLRIYNSVDGKTQTQIMMYMYEIESKFKAKE